jgi:tetratricopeptide (TPR) repeat protein
MSNTIVRDEEIELGRVIRENLEQLRARPPIPLPEFLGADGRTRWLTQETESRLFDAQAWAFAHYLLFGEKGAHRAKLNRFTQLLRDATTPELALREAFGDPAPYYEATREYVQRSLFAYMTVPLSLDSRPEGYASRALSEAEAAVSRGELLAAMRRPVEARAFAAAADPSLPGPWEIEAELLELEGARDRAKAAYLKAADAGSRRAHVYYRLAQLESNNSRDKAVLERVSGWLEKARELEPGNADVLAFLAKVRDSLEQNAEALPLARKAVELEPDASYHRLVLASVLWSARQRDAAIQMARTALQVAEGEEERRQAQEFLDFANKH